ncbi:MAG: alpha-1,2-fucosyltransferase [Acidimicrobiales bacterium]
MAIGVRLMGGIGNQMFQYAAARSLAARRGTGVAVDLSWFVEQSPSGDTQRAYALDVFVGPAAASKTEIPTGRSFREQGFGFDASVLQLPDSSTLIGYFQSERYFLEHAPVIEKEFSFLAQPDRDNRSVLELISSSESVAVHVRRGDYTNNPTTKAHHGLLPLDYYRRAVDDLTARVLDPRFFVFSDDPMWCRRGLSFLRGGVVVDHNRQESGAEDLRLMAACRHHIIANSTFSWWGAWLATRPEQIVVAPRRWFAGSSLDAAQLCPSRWLLR